ncbi:MAG: ABC transporter ATP-binding protein [Nevskia sp.]|nr:ABC transporter ATP-binding protein [Nevskia sp.]
MTAALQLRGVARTFDGKQAVDGLDMRIERGEFYALLGANGAGKTTTLRMIAGLLQPDSGSIEVLGHDLVQQPIAAKQRLAFLPDEPLLYGKLRCTEYLEFVAGLWGVDGRVAEKKGEELLRWLDLWDARGNYCENLSRGMQQKLTLAGALIHDPALLILDEPLTGLDVAAARRVKDFLSQLVRDGLTVLFTTHILEVAERMASRIGLIRSGRLIAEGTLDELRARYGADDSTLEELFLSATGPETSA